MRVLPRTLSCICGKPAELKLVLSPHSRDAETVDDDGEDPEEGPREIGWEGLGVPPVFAGESLGTLDLAATFKDVPGGTADWTFTGNGNYNDQSGDVTIVITKADATCTVSGYSDVYDAAFHGATGSCTGVGGEDLGRDWGLAEGVTGGS